MEKNISKGMRFILTVAVFGLAFIFPVGNNHSFILKAIAQTTSTVYVENGPTPSQNLYSAYDYPRYVLDNQRVFLFGDSQAAGPPGRALMHHVVAAGANYYTRAGETGWGVPNWWQHRWNLSRFFERHSPTLVVIMLGGNDSHRVTQPDYEQKIRTFWQYVVERARANTRQGSQLSVCWVEPVRVVGPRAEELQPKRDEVSRVIQRVVGRNHFIQSSDITGQFGRTSDGVHFTYEGAQNWMRQMIPRLARCVKRQHSNVR